MPIPDTTFELTDFRDEIRPTRSGEIERNKRYTFYLGKWGPFVERVPLDHFDPTEITRRVTTLRAHLTQLHT